MKFNQESFRKDIILKRSLSRGMGMRACAKEIGISAATLSRIENCSKIPDLMTYAKVCKWLGKKLDKYFK